MDNTALDYQKASHIQESFNRYSNKMRDLRTKKFDAIVEYRMKIDVVKLDKLKSDFERTHKNV